MLPLHLHGWNRGSTGVLSPRQILQVSSSSDALLVLGWGEKSGSFITSGLEEVSDGVESPGSVGGMGSSASAMLSIGARLLDVRGVTSFATKPSIQGQMPRLGSPTSSRGGCRRRWESSAAWLHSKVRGDPGFLMGGARQRKRRAVVSL